MRIPVRIILFISSLTVPFFPAAGADKSDRVENLIRDLSSDEFKTREEATRELWEIGRDVLEPLREASLSEDPERALRAARILEKIGLRITPETEEEVLSLVRSYRLASDGKKADLIDKMKEARAFYQLLKFYSMESPEMKIKLASNVEGVAVVGAREAISRGEPEAAIEMLRLSAGNHNDLMALASVYRNTGRIDRELENPDPPVGVPAARWKLALLRAKGDLRGAIAFAAESEQTRILAGLEIIAGDPTRWLRQNGFGEESAKALESYVGVAVKRWNGKEVEKGDLAPLVDLMESGNQVEKIHAMSSLASLGELEMVQEAETARSPAQGFSYHLSQENIGKALKAFGLDPEDPDYAGWVRERFEKEDVFGNRREVSNGISELQMMAAFLENRGLHNELATAFSEPLQSHAEDHGNEFLDFLGNLFSPSFGAPEFAADQAAQWAGDDDGRWEDVFTKAFGSSGQTREWLEWINEIEAGMSRRETLGVMLALFGKSTSPGSRRLEWMEKIWASVEGTADADLKAARVKRVLSLTVGQSDVRNALRAWDMLGEEEKEAATWGSIDKFLSAAGRWKEAAELFEKKLNDRSRQSPAIHAYLAVHFRRAGMERKARKHERMAERLALDDAETCVRIGAYYAYGGDSDRAAAWQRRAVMTAPVFERVFVAALNAYATTMMRAENWRVAASCHEALMQVYASRGYMNGGMAGYAKARLNADLARAMKILPENEGAALEIFKSIHRNFATDGVLADDFFPLLRKAGLDGHLEKWFGRTWERLVAVIEKYPESHNTRNTAAWFAARAGLKLDPAERYLRKALEQAPEQPAYLDTMAELKFAKGNREAAIKLSDRALQFSPYEEMIRMQNERFRTAGLPLRR